MVPTVSEKCEGGTDHSVNEQLVQEASGKRERERLGQVAVQCATPLNLKSAIGMAAKEHNAAKPQPNEDDHGFHG